MQVLKDSQFTVFFDRHQAIYGWSVKTEEHDDVDGGREFLERLHEQCLLSRGCEPKVVRLEPILFRAGNPEMQDLHIRARRIIRKSATDPQEAGEELSELIKETEA